MNQRLRNWIRNQLNKGFSQRQIVSSLINSGYNQSDARSKVRKVRTRLNRSATNDSQRSNQYNPEYEKAKENNSTKKYVLGSLVILGLIGLGLGLYSTGFLENSSDSQSFDQLISLSEESTYQANYSVQGNASSTIQNVQVIKNAEKRKKSFDLMTSQVAGKSESVRYHSFNDPRAEFRILCTDSECSYMNVMANILGILITSPFDMKDDREEIETVYKGETTLNGRNCKLYDINASREVFYEEYRISSEMIDQNNQSSNIILEACVDTEKGFFNSVNITAPNDDSRLSLIIDDYSSRIDDTKLMPPSNAVIRTRCSRAETHNQRFSYGINYELNNATIVPTGTFSRAELEAGNMTEIIQLGEAYEELTVDLSQSSSDTVNVTIGSEELTADCYGAGTGGGF